MILDPIRWLHRQRWFQGKARTVTRTRVADTTTLGGSVRWLLLDVDYAGHPTERYQVVLVPAGTAGAATAVQIAGAAWVDAAGTADLLRPLAVLAAEGGSLATGSGATIDGDPTGPGTVPPSGRTLGVEQSNTSLVFGETVMLKLFRRIERGINPDIELTGVLTAAGSTHVPRQIGALTYGSDGAPAALGVLTEFVADAREGWQLAVRDAAAAFDGTGTAPAARPFIARLADLGGAVADTHATLAATLPSGPATADDVAAWSAAVGHQIDAVLDDADGALPVDRGALHRAREAATAGITTPGLCARAHGDLHLGQVIDSRRGWQLLDFEGEPARPLDERRALTSPARDLAGMIRSFDYAAV
ncbi:MAG TPA: hypothetical protein VK875_12370, partial [Euzebyales bacterium]|nr:hypothetical protein [Euzebyales bacterium]